MHAAPPPSPRDRLSSIAVLLDESSARSDVDLHVYVTDDGRAFELGLRALDPRLHPCEELRGLVAAEDWWAVGLVLHGRLRFLDGGDRGPEPIRSTYLVARDGTEVSLLRRGDEVTELAGPAEGRLPDLLRTMLGLP